MKDDPDPYSKSIVIPTSKHLLASVYDLGLDGGHKEKVSLMSPVKPHFSFWIVAALGLVWNLVGCLNYVVQTNPDVVAQMPETYQVIVSGRPAWATAAFAIAVFGGAVGCILLLLRRRVAIGMLVLSLIGIIGTAVFTAILIGLVPSVMMSFLVGAALLWYATIAQRKGWLR